MKTRLLLFAMLWLALGSVKAQIVTTTPTPLTQDSEGIVVYYHADLGNKQLMGQPSTAALYAHTGVITSQSGSDSDWQYAPKWLDNAAKYKLEYVSENLWKLNIGTIDGYYGITDPSVEVKKLAFVFRNADGSLEGKTSGNGDIFVTVHPAGLHIELTSSLEGKVVTAPTEATFTVNSTSAAALSLSVNGSEIASASGVTTLSKSYRLDNPGTFSVTATAVAGEETATLTETFLYLTEAEKKDYPGGVPVMGTVRGDDGKVTFCLAAPQKTSCLLVGSWTDYDMGKAVEMYCQDYEGARYFWTTVEGLAADTAYPYYYLVDGETAVGDPYARLVLDPYNDQWISETVYPDMPKYPTDKVQNVVLAVYQENINDYDWQCKDFERADPSNLMIYELLFRDFTGTEGKALGDGTVRKAIAKIPYLKDLGVNAVELLPINEFNGNQSWGYNPNFYFAPDKAYGTPDDYKEFIDKCHAAGIAVILDMVFNQTDWLHPWYQLYPVGSNPFYNADAPHAYSVLNDWNQGNALVQKQFEDCLQYWLTEYNVDGFRFDLVKGLGNNDSYANSGSAATDAYNQSRIDRMKRLHDAMRAVDPTAYFINENLAGAQEETEMAKDGELNWANVNPMGGQYAKGDQSNSGLVRFYAPWDSRPWGSTVSYLESHDEQRLAYMQEQEGVTGIKGNLPNSMRRLGSAAAQMILTPGAHMIWQFSELGNNESTKNSSGNDVGPKKVLWSYMNVATRKGLLTSYRELNDIRLSNPELFAQDATFEASIATTDWSAGRLMRSSKGDKEIITVINPNVNPKETITMSVAFGSKDDSSYEILSKSYNTTPTFSASAGTVTVPGNSYVVIGTKAVVTEVAEAQATSGWRLAGRQLQVSSQSPVKVVTLSGSELWRGTSGSVELPAGVYVILEGAASPAKVLVP